MNTKTKSKVSEITKSVYLKEMPGNVHVLVRKYQIRAFNEGKPEPNIPEAIYEMIQVAANTLNLK